MEIEINTNCGVYELRHIASNTAYVGSSRNLKKRKYRHFRDMFTDSHDNYKMQAAYNASTGNSAFQFSVLEYCSPDQRKAIEQVYMDSGNFAFNISTKAEGGCGPINESTRAKIGAGQMGERNHLFKGWYTTPFGRFASTLHAADTCGNTLSYQSIWKVCQAPDTIITKKAFVKSRYLQTHYDRSVIGVSWRSLGFSFEPVTKN